LNEGQLNTNIKKDVHKGTLGGDLHTREICQRIMRRSEKLQVKRGVSWIPHSGKTHTLPT